MAERSNRVGDGHSSRNRVGPAGTQIPCNAGVYYREKTGALQMQYLAGGDRSDAMLRSAPCLYLFLLLTPAPP